MNRDMTIVFKADTSQAIAGMKGLEAQFRTMESVINASIGSYGSMRGQIEDLDAKMHGASAAIGRASKSAEGFTSSLMGMGAGFIVIKGGISAIGALGEMANKTRDHIKELAIETMDLREEMRELANLKNATGPDNIIASETLQMGMAAGMMPKEMVAYLEQFEGSSPAGEQKGNIDPQTKKELALEGAKFASRVKLSGATGGDLAGVISQYTDLTHDKNGKEVPQAERTEKAMAQMGRIEHGLQQGRGHLETLTRSLINVAGAVVSMGGPIEDMGDLAAIQGVASTHANPKESGTRVRQAVRALRDTKGNAGTFLTKTAGIDDDDTHVERLEKLKKQIDGAKAKGMAGDTYLRRAGFTDEDEMRAVLEQVEDLDIIKQRISEGRAKITGKAVMEKDAAFQTNERVGVRRKQKATKAAQEFLIGEGRERYEMARENAEQEMRDKHEIGGFGNDLSELVEDIGGLRQWLGGESTREQRKGQRAEKNLIKEAEQIGIPYDEAMRIMGRKQVPGKWSNETYDEAMRIMGRKQVPGKWSNETDEQARVQAFNKLATEVERKGGNAYGSGPDLSPKFDALIKETQETNRILKQNLNGGPAGPPAAGAGAAPAIPPLRGAAAPKR